MSHNLIQLGSKRRLALTWDLEHVPWSYKHVVMAWTCLVKPILLRLIVATVAAAIHDHHRCARANARIKWNHLECVQCILMGEMCTENLDMQRICMHNAWMCACPVHVCVCVCASVCDLRCLYTKPNRIEIIEKYRIYLTEYHMPLVMLEARMRVRHLSVLNLPWVHETAHEIALNLPWVHETAHEIAHESLHETPHVKVQESVIEQLLPLPHFQLWHRTDWKTPIPEEVQTCDRRCQADSSKTSRMTALSEHAMQENNLKTVIHHRCHHSQVQSKHEPFKTNIMPACRHTFRACATTFSTSWDKYGSMLGKLKSTALNMMK